MGRLLPKGTCPGKLTVLHHSLVSTPRTIHEHIQRVVLDSREHFSGVVVLRMVATDSNNAGWKVCSLDAPTCADHCEAGLGQAYSNTTAHTSAGASNNCSLHRPICGFLYFFSGTSVTLT